MIIDNIENASLYAGVSKPIKKALNYIQNTDFTNIKLGKHQINGDNMYALVNEYETKNATESFLEGHRKYIDVQFIIDGTEQIGYTALANQIVTKKYDSKDDYLLFNDQHSMISLKKGMFAIFFPNDLHMPGIKIEKSSIVKKVVVKVKI